MQTGASRNRTTNLLPRSYTYTTVTLGGCVNMICLGIFAVFIKFSELMLFRKETLRK